MTHRVYEAIVDAVKGGTLVEPFDKSAFEAACSGFGAGTYNAFLHKHCQGNSGGNSELFRRVARGQFRCIRPFKYGL